MDTWMYLLHTITLYQNTPFRGQERRHGTKMAQTLSVNTNIKKQKHRETQRNTFYRSTATEENPTNVAGKRDHQNTKGPTEKAA